MNQERAPLLIAVDDQRFYLDEIGFELEGKNIEYRSFEGPSAFEEEALENDINRAALILMDYDFGTTTVIQRDLVGYIRDTYPNFSGKIVLLSLIGDLVRDEEAIRKDFDGIINKKDLTWNQIEGYLN